MRKADYHKSHIFDVKNGCQIVKEGSKPVTNYDVDLSIAQVSEEFDATQTGFNAAGTMTRLPAWVAFDRKVLRFFAYFKERVFASNMESSRVRKCVIYYYLDDNTIHVAEPKVENSGIPQGVFLKRHRVPKSDNAYLGIEDLQIGNEVEIYGRTFRVYDADQHTRQFLAESGMALADPEGVPRDAFSKKHTPAPENFNKKMHDMKRHMEAKLGKMMQKPVPDNKRFLTHDNHVLRFYCVWSDSSTYGEQRPYLLHYFKSDESIEVLEVAQPNSGREAFPTFCKRGKLPKDHTKTAPLVSRIGWTADKSVQYYKEEDLRIGATVNCYGRDLELRFCDQSTKRYYMDNYGMTEDDFPQLLPETIEAQVPTMAPPPYTGFGTEEDSLGSFLYLNPKVPKTDYKKLMENHNNILAFKASMVNGQPEDKDRVFIIKFYPKNDTLSVFEEYKRNSGFIGGKFLEPRRMINVDTNQFFAEPDFQVGSVLKINGHHFLLTESDEWTKKFMAANPERFATDF